MAVTNVKWKKINQVFGQPPKPRHGHRALAIRDIIVIFGGGNEGIIDELHVFNTATKQWHSPVCKGEIPRGCASFGFAQSSSKIYVFGGMIEYGRYTDELYELHTLKWTWRRLLPSFTSINDVPCPRLGHSFTYFDGRIYLFGGLANDSNDPKNNIPRYLNDLYVLDVRCDPPVWTVPLTSGDPPTPRESHSCVVYRNKNNVPQLVIYGGMSGVRLGDVYILNLDTLVWKKIITTGPKPIPRSCHSAVLIDENMYIFGGWIPLIIDDMKVTMQEKEWRCTNTLASLNLETFQWTALGAESTEDDVPRARAGHCAINVCSRMYIWSGRDGYRKAWNNQVCCKDMWALDVACPCPPSRLQLLRATSSAIQICWSGQGCADYYFVQIQKVEKSEENQKCITNNHADGVVSVETDKNRVQDPDVANKPNNVVPNNSLHNKQSFQPVSKITYPYLLIPTGHKSLSNYTTSSNVNTVVSSASSTQNLPKVITVPSSSSSSSSPSPSTPMLTVYKAAHGIKITPSPSKATANAPQIQQIQPLGMSTIPPIVKLVPSASTNFPSTRTINTSSGPQIINIQNMSATRPLVLRNLNNQQSQSVKLNMPQSPLVLNVQPSSSKIVVLNKPSADSEKTDAQQIPNQSSPKGFFDNLHQNDMNNQKYPNLPQYDGIFDTQALVISCNSEKSLTENWEASSLKAPVQVWHDAGVFNETSCIISSYFLEPLQFAQTSCEPIKDFSSVPKADLEPGTIFRVRVISINAIGVSEYSDVAVFKTFTAGFPGAPSAVKIFRANDGSAELMWEPPPDEFSVIDYIVYLAIKGADDKTKTDILNEFSVIDDEYHSFPKRLTFVKVYNGSSCSCTVSSIDLERAFVDFSGKPAIIFRIAARNDKGLGPATQVRWLQDNNKNRSFFEHNLETKRLRLE